MISVEIDKASAERVNRDLKRYGMAAAKAVMDAILRTAYAIETDAKNRLNGKLGSARHWVTGRLASSVHVETDRINSFVPITDSKSGDRSLNAPVSGAEALVGTNVEYAHKIEFDYDSFLQFAANRQAKNLPKRVNQELDKVAKKGFFERLRL